MADDHVLTRRDSIRNAAVAAGLIWSAPVIRSATMLGAVGTPVPPTSTTMGNPTVTHYEFRAFFLAPNGLGPPVAGCPGGTSDITYTADIIDAGPAAVAQHTCLAEIRFPLTVTGTLTFTRPDGTIDATFAGSGSPDATGSEIDFDTDVVVDGGTGRFAGARGAGTFTSRLFNSTGEVDGRLDGSFDVT